MIQEYVEDADSVMAENPFAVRLRSLDQSVVLIRRSRTRHGEAGFCDRAILEQYLSGARSDVTLMAQLRGLHAETIHAAVTPNYSDQQIVNGIADAVLHGQILAVLANNTIGLPVRTTEIDYRSVLARASNDLFAYICDKFPDLWCRIYGDMPGAGAEIVSINDQGYTFLFDMAAERVIAAFGTSRYNPANRDSARMAGFLANAQLSWRERFFQKYGHKYDRGHFMSHRQGGGLDINLFPQLAEINQGRGKLGRIYRAMERACVDNPGVFCFSRPIYHDATWVPVQLEYGIVHDSNRIEISLFPNK